MPLFLSPLLKSPRRPYRLENTRNQRVVATALIPAFESASRRTGLLAHQAMPAGAAMIIAPCNAVHTIGMKFPIDIAFVAKDGRIIKIRHDVPARRMAASLRAFAVIELAAGVLTATDTKVGDTFVIVE